MSDQETLEKFKTQAYLIQSAIDGMEILTKPRLAAESEFTVKPFSEYFDFFRQDYRVATPTAEDIDWSKIEKGYNWVAVEDNGETYAYSHKPYFDATWQVDEIRGTAYTKLPNLHKRGGDWAIFERPIPNYKQGKLTEYMSGDGYSVKVEYLFNGATIDMPAHWVATVFDALDDEPIEDIGGFSVIRQSLVDSIKKQLELRFTKPKKTLEDFEKSISEELGNLRKLYDWFSDEDDDKPTVEMCIQRLEEMRRAEITLRKMVREYNHNQLFLNQHQFPIEDNVATSPAIRQISTTIS